MIASGLGDQALLARNVHALPRISVPAGPVASAVDHALDGLDTQIGVAPGFIPGQSRSGAIDGDAVRARAQDMVRLITVCFGIESTATLILGALLRWLRATKLPTAREPSNTRCIAIPSMGPMVPRGPRPSRSTAQAAASMRRIKPHIRNAPRPMAIRRDPAIRKLTREAGSAGSARPIRTRETISRIRPETKAIEAMRVAPPMIPPRTIQRTSWISLRATLSNVRVRTGTGDQRFSPVSQRRSIPFR
jgi:hypothetical protein